MYSRDEVEALTDKVLNMTKADAAEVEFSGGERAGTRGKRQKTEDGRRKG